MAVIQHHFYSCALTECNSMMVYVPIETRPMASYPILWLLSPFGCDHTAWGRHTDLEALAERTGILIAVPDMKLSFGTDMVHGLRYHTMLTEELPKALAVCYPADPIRQMIAGAREGGYIAMLASLTHPEQYEKILSFSCGSLADVIPEPGLVRPFSLAFGTETPQKLEGSDYDLKSRIRSGGAFPGGKLIWSPADPYSASCRALAALLPEDQTQIVPTDRPLGWDDWFAALEQNL